MPRKGTFIEGEQYRHDDMSAAEVVTASPDFSVVDESGSHHRNLSDAPVQGGPRHPKITCHLGGQLPALISLRALWMWESVKVCRRPPRSLPAALRWPTESGMRFWLVSSSILCRATITVNTTEPIDVAESTSFPPRYSARRLTPYFVAARRK